MRERVEREGAGGAERVNRGGDGDGWTKVGSARYSKRMQWDIVRGCSRVRGGSTTTFFFTSFPDKLGAKDLVRVFGDYGRVDEVVILARRNKQGRKFGFVRFFEVSDVDMLALKLDKIFLGKQNLFVNLPRYHRPHRALHGVLKPMVVASDLQVEVRQKEFPRVRDGRSYVAAALGRSSSSVVPPPYQMVFDKVDEGAISRFSKAFVDKVVMAGTTYDIQEVFDMEGYFGVKVTPLGARLCLLEDRGEGVLEELIDSGASWLDRWFVEIKRWDPGVVDEERVTWVLLFGLSCHLWNDVFFKFICTPFGSFLRPDDFTSCHAKFDVARLLIRTSCVPLISESLMVKAGGLFLRLRVVEDTQGPFPFYVSKGMDGEAERVSSEEEVDDDSVGVE
ncbi:uncharacterized protein LOC131650787 [Vicia villosa]|uniref:uncharacterized protein LOC131650787 n=1 Tax=Vicia villosa TaxID=3911 RepID=UPI00273B63D0|nr:uncharacterized protein LOC131650787 [Vicia villosa]